jgi:ribose transport system permease protein
VIFGSFVLAIILNALGVFNVSSVNLLLQGVALIDINAVAPTTRIPSAARFLAIGNRQAAARLSGVRLGRIHAIVFILSALGAAFVGLLLNGYASQAYLGMGNDYLMPPVAAVVIGGTRLTGGEGGYVGSIAGALIVVLLQAMLITLNVSEGARQVIFGAILLALAFLFIRRSR